MNLINPLTPMTAMATMNLIIPISQMIPMTSKTPKPQKAKYASIRFLELVNASLYKFVHFSRVKYYAEYNFATKCTLLISKLLMEFCHVAFQLPSNVCNKKCQYNKTKFKKSLLESVYL